MAQMRATITTINRAPQRDYAAALERELSAAVYQHAQAVMGASQLLCPVESGYLRATAFVNPPEVANGHVTVTLGYGAYYAIFVHEILSARHPVGQAKFLEQPMLAMGPEYRARVIAAVTRAFA